MANFRSISESIKAGLIAAVLMSLVQSAIAFPPMAATRAEPKILIPEKNRGTRLSVTQNRAKAENKSCELFFHDSGLQVTK